MGCLGHSSFWNCGGLLFETINVEIAVYQHSTVAYAVDSDSREVLPLCWKELEILI